MNYREFPVHLELVNGKKKVKFPDGWADAGKDFLSFKGNSKAIRTGKGLIVVDIDTKDFKELGVHYGKFFKEQLKDKSTRIVETTQGYHFYYKIEDEYKNSVKINSYPIDIRADGGCVFISTEAKGLTYECISEEIATAPEVVRGLLNKPDSIITKYENEDNKRVRIEDREPNFALFEAVNSGNINRIIPATGMKTDDFTQDTINYVTFNRFVFILANEPSIKNEDVEAIVRMLVEEKLGFEWGSDITQEMYQQSLSTMVWAREYIEPENKVFMDRNGYYVITTDKELITGVKKTAMANGFCGEYYVPLKKVPIILDIEERIDYTADRALEAYRDDRKCLKVVCNPSKTWIIPENFNDEIINDFERFIWEDKLEDFISIIALTLKFRENKNNKLLLVAPRDKGKSAIAEELMSFTKIMNSEFNSLLRKNNPSQMSEDTYKEIKKSGLLLVDEANDYLPDDNFKGATEELKVRVMYKGPQRIPVNFMLFTSTHAGVLESLNGEFASRLMSLQLVNEDNTILNSPMYKKYGRERYREETSAYCRKLMIEKLEGDYTIDVLKALQEKYKLDLSNNTRAIQEDDFRDEIRERLIGKATKHNKEYFIKSPVKVIKKVVNEIFEESDTKIHNVIEMKEKLVNYFKNQVGNITSLSINGKKLSNLYKINLASEEEELRFEEEF